jgi:predicted metalloprotease with PDZ domain
MKTLRTALLLAAFVLAGALSAVAQAPVVYNVDLAGRDHHEMQVEVRFADLASQPLEIRMSRTSPGRYALHEFSKNVYSVSAVDGKGRALEIERPDLHQWSVGGHDGTVVFRYTLFGDRSDGTYAAIDSSHAHLNVPASFVWARGLEQRQATICFDAPEDWQVWTQLERDDAGCVVAPNLAYFIDSPIEVSAAERFAWTVDGEGDGQTIEVVLHHTGEASEAELLADVTKLVVDEQIAIYGEAPAFDTGRYTFLVDALPWSNGDGMEHRNSTIVATSGTVLDRIDGLVGTISHEFFHAWNVERIRPRSLEPFDLEAANVSRELWFAEGFTSYYGALVLARIGAEHLESYAEGLGGNLNYVLTYPGVNLRSPAEMSSRAPFVDAAQANEPTIRSNTFISYYSYGSALALALDLTLRTEFEDLTLDNFMRAAWKRFGEPEIPYENEDLRRLLGELTGSPEMADAFFEQSIYGTQPPDFESLLARVGLRLRAREAEGAWLGPLQFEFQEADEVRQQRAGLRLQGSPRVGSPLYAAGVGRNDVLVSFDGIELTSLETLTDRLEGHNAGDVVSLVLAKRGEERAVEVTLADNPSLEVVTFEAAGEELSEEARMLREAWLAPRSTPRLNPVRYCPETGQPHPYRYYHCPIHGGELEPRPKSGPGRKGAAPR